ncbi:uncharacterized protein MONBRDRAFT_26199 [Monosiga brevicollis MX1]|uniref:Protein kinase domain-containing protein n=1 Tax=Monosiga brevicollis TaxID=81824 RepID=A9V1M9_MONBE|nr:uncharacterized protein MONBRDRAFT_26199 [Monosiga brevicollis MX1]EDQ88468.1 predicted protein [Monosiga brevicollis MX1]|eukprot:XP_001746572.1 hypothetical protein [Monosiga brevicollis MX1]
MWDLAHDWRPWLLFALLWLVALVLGMASMLLANRRRLRHQSDPRNISIESVHVSDLQPRFGLAPQQLHALESRSRGRYHETQRCSIQPVERPKSAARHAQRCRAHFLLVAAARSEQLACWRYELKHLATLQPHPNVAALIGFYQTPSEYALVLEVGSEPANPSCQTTIVCLPFSLRSLAVDGLDMPLDVALQQMEQHRDQNSLMEAELLACGLDMILALAHCHQLGLTLGAAPLASFALTAQNTLKLADFTSSFDVHIQLSLQDRVRLPCYPSLAPSVLARWTSGVEQAADIWTWAHNVHQLASCKTGPIYPPADARSACLNSSRAAATKIKRCLEEDLRLISHRCLMFV